MTQGFAPSTSSSVVVSAGSPHGTRLVHIVDDDESVRESASILLESAGYEVVTHESGVAFLNALDHLAPGCIILDIHMPVLTGLQVQEELVGRGIGWPVIVLTGQGDVGIAVQAMKNGAFEYMEKPYKNEALLQTLHDAWDRASRMVLMDTGFREAADMADVSSPVARTVCVAYMEGAIGAAERVRSISALFPQVEFVSLGPVWPSRPIPGLGAMIVAADARDPEAVLRRLATQPQGPPLIIALENADVATTRQLIRAGVMDVLPTPVSEAALALSLERLLGSGLPVHSPRSSGSVVALLGTGGGSGATALGVQLASILARRTGVEGEVCFADLDIQFGLAALYFDLTDTISLNDILATGGLLEDAPLNTALGRARSGVRVLGAPRDLTPLDTISTQDIEHLVTAMRRHFRVTILDLPTVWTAWTYRALQLSDRIIAIGDLSVPRINLLKRQLRLLELQQLNNIPTTLVCNRVTQEKLSVVSIKSAEKALGRDFDVVMPKDDKLMLAAIAQGCELSDVQRGSKLEKEIGKLADIIEPSTVAPAPVRRRLWP